MRIPLIFEWQALSDLELTLEYPPDPLPLLRSVQAARSALESLGRLDSNHCRHFIL